MVRQMINITNQDYLSKIRVHLSITRNCNLDCEYCCVPTEKRVLEAQTAEKVIDWLADNFRFKVLDLVLLGGEPLLYIDMLKKYVRYWRERAAERNKSIIISVITNGTLLDNDTVKWMQKHIDAVSVSLDGNEDNHNLHRKYSNGDGTYNVITENLKNLLYTHDTIGTISVITRNNLPNLFDNIKHIVGLGIKNIFYQPLFPPSENWSKTEYELLEDQLKRVYRYWIESQYTTRPFRLLSGHGIFLAGLKKEQYKRKCSPAYMFISEEGYVYHCQDVETMNIPCKNTITSVNRIPDANWIKHWWDEGKIDCDECKVTKHCSETGQFYPEVIKKIYQIEENVCCSLLPELQSMKWFGEFTKLRA